MALTTSFRSTGTCAHCGTRGDMWIQSHLGSRGHTYRAGDDIEADIPLSEMEAASFLVRAPTRDEPIRVMSTWSCVHCNCENFAELVFDRGRLADIAAVALSTSVLDRLHFIEEAMSDSIEAIIGHSMWDERGVWPGWLARLREVLGGPTAGGEHTLVATTVHAAEAAVPEDPFPVGYSLDHGRFEVDELYLGGGADQLSFGHGGEWPGARFLISTAPDNGLEYERVSRDVMRPAPGLFVPQFLGGFDLPPASLAGGQRRSECAFVEELPRGRPLRQALPDPHLHALDLGAQIGRLLGQAVTDAGILNVGLRPEYVWATVDNGAPTVTGLGGRNHVFFASARRRRDLPTAPLFTHRYWAPEVNRGEAHDERALVLTLAVMVAEWIVGAYPYPTGDGAWGYRRLCAGEHVELPVEPSLAALLSAALRPDPGDRPSLATFTAGLAAFADRREAQG